MGSRNRGYRVNILYLITNTYNNKKYIGITSQTIEKRLQRHFITANNGSNYAIHRAMRKYNKSFFAIKKIHIFSNKNELLLAESLFILYYNTKGKLGYNMTDGGEGVSGQIWSAKRLKNHKLRIKSYNWAIDNSIPVIRNDGKIYKSMRLAAKDINTCTQAVKTVVDGLGNSVKGYFFMPTSPKLRRKQIKNINSRNINKRKLIKRIVDNRGRIYESLQDAARKLDLHASAIHLVLKKRQNSTKGYAFKYKKEKYG